jgi:hypothetical protein
VFGKDRTARHPRAERCVEYEDFVAAGFEGLVKAIRGYRPGANNGLNAYARRYIRGEINKVFADWRNKPGLKNESRLHRWIRAHPFAHPSWIKERFPKLSIEQIEHEQQLCHAMWQPKEYREGSFDAQNNDGSIEEKEAGLEAHLSPFVSEWSRNSAFVAPLWNDTICNDADTRAKDRLKQIGRQAYADELIANARKLYRERYPDENLRNVYPALVPVVRSEFPKTPRYPRGHAWHNAACWVASLA